jgi:septum formation protein
VFDQQIVNDQTAANAEPPLVLASASPRRRELLGWLGARFEAIATDAEEQDIPTPPHILARLPAFPLPLKDHPTLLAWRKVNHVAERLSGHVILGADTIVVLDASVLNKPRDPDEARHMLKRLSGRVHTVYTGLCARSAAHSDAAELWFELVASQVEIMELNEAQIAAYVATGEPLDKAGAYGIQGLGGQLVRRVVGSYTAVVGLPVMTVYQMLNAAGIQRLSDPTQAYHAWVASQGKEPLPCPPTLP